MHATTKLADSVHRPTPGASQLLEFTVPAPNRQNQELREDAVDAIVLRVNSYETTIKMWNSSSGPVLYTCEGTVEELPSFNCCAFSYQAK